MKIGKRLKILGKGKYLSLLFLLLGILIWLRPKPILACSCDIPTLKQDFESSTAVFSGIVVAESDTLDNHNVPKVIYTVKVFEVWKGLAADTLKVTSGRLWPGGTCDAVVISYSMLVFAYGPEDDLQVSLCSHTGMLTRFDTQMDRQQLRQSIKQPAFFTHRRRWLGLYIMTFILGGTVLIKWQKKLSKKMIQLIFIFLLLLFVGFNYTFNQELFGGGVLFRQYYLYESIFLMGVSGALWGAWLQMAWSESYTWLKGIALFVSLYWLNNIFSMYMYLS